MQKKDVTNKGERNVKNELSTHMKYFLLGTLASIFDIDNVKSGFKTILKRRPNNLRSLILVLGELFYFAVFVEIR